MPADRGFAAVALVTGANRGIGFEVTRQLAEGGLIVLLGSRDRERGNAAAGQLAAAGDIVPIRLDVTEHGDIDDARRFVEDQFGQLDVLVNNAAEFYDSDQTPTSVDLGDVRRSFETNLFGPWELVQAFVPLLRRSEHPRIVNVSSESGSFEASGGLRADRDPSGSVSSYGASKAALNALTVKLAAELRSDGILVNAVCPGHTATDMGGGGRPVPDGAASVVWAASLPDDGPTGSFFRDGVRLPW